MRSPLLVAVALVYATPAAARRPPKPQRHEVQVDFDLRLAEKARVGATPKRSGTSTLVDITYFYTPGSLDKNDIVVALLRPFVRHVSRLRAHVWHFGSELGNHYGVAVGALHYLAGGRAYVDAGAGIQIDEVLTDRAEDDFWTAPLHLEAGGRPLALVQLGAYLDARPTICWNKFCGSGEEGFAGGTITRSGWDHELGVKLAAATPNDRVYAIASAGWRSVDWEFAGTSHPGEVTASGWNARALVSLQTSPSFSWFVQGDLRREDWKNRREGDADYVDPLDRTVTDFSAQTGILYWFEGKLGFRVFVGGGYRDDRPDYDGAHRRFGEMGFAFHSRF